MFDQPIESQNLTSQARSYQTQSCLLSGESQALKYSMEPWALNPEPTP